MTQQVKAIYEHGVLRPLQPVSLREHQKVILLLDTSEESPAPNAIDKPIWDVAAGLVSEVPDEAFAATPSDAAAQHEH